MFHFFCFGGGCGFNGILDAVATLTPYLKCDVKTGGGGLVKSLAKEPLTTKSYVNAA